MDDLLQALKDSPKAEGQDRIYVAGEPEWECEQERRRDGHPARARPREPAPRGVGRRRPSHSRSTLEETLDAPVRLLLRSRAVPARGPPRARRPRGVGGVRRPDGVRPLPSRGSTTPRRAGSRGRGSGALAARTKRVRIATAVTCPLFHYHPGLIAQAAATVDRLSGGRFALGVGTGEGINERPLGFPFPGYKERAARMTEAIAIMRALLAGEKLDFAGHLLPDRQGPPLQPAGRPGPDLDVGRGPAVRDARGADRRRAHPERQGSRGGAGADHRPVPRGRAGCGPARADAGGAALVDPRRGRGRGLAGPPGLARAPRRGAAGGGRSRRAAGPRRRHGPA